MPANISSEITGQVFIIIGIIIASVFVVFALIAFVYFALKCIKSMFEPQYYIDEIPTNKDNSENNEVPSHVLDVSQIQPSLSIVHMFASVKQCLIDLRDSLIPFSWSQAQHVHHQQNSINEKMDLPI